MATVNIGSVDEEFVTCGVCMNEYDELLKIPKCLPCSHTICLACLEGILHEDWMKCIHLKCPFCRNVSQHKFLTEDSDLNRADLIRKLLPNNIYTLQIIKLNKQIASSTNSDKLEQSWCFSCGSETIDSCSSLNHHTGDLTVGTIRNLENFAKAKKEAGIKKEIENLTKAIAKEKHASKNLEFLTVSVEAAQEEIKQLQQENILRLTHMASKLTALKATQPTEEVVSRDIPAHFFSSEVWSLLNNNDSTMVDAGKEKLNEPVDEYHKESLKVTSESELFKKLGILVKIVDEKNHVVPECSLLIRDGHSWGKINGNVTKVLDPFITQESALLSHVVFSLLQRQKMFHLLSGVASNDHEDSD